MFKAKIVQNMNGKQTVVEFDNEKEYYDYLEARPELNDPFLSSSWKNFLPWGLNFNPYEDMQRLLNQTLPSWNYQGNQKDLSPLGLVRQDLKRLDYEEKKKEEEEKQQERQKERQAQELKEAKELLEVYKNKDGYDPEHAKKLEEYIESLETNSQEA